MMDSNPQGRYLGKVVGGSLGRGIEVRLDPSAPVEEMALGQHVVIQGQIRRFFGIITDITLESSDDSIKTNPISLHTRRGSAVLCLWVSGRSVCVVAISNSSKIPGTQLH